jgi:hypothetical protein
MRYSNEYEDAARLTLRDGGGTFAVDGKVVHHTRGYYVGGIVPTSVVPVAGGTENLAESLARFANQHRRDIGAVYSTYIGTWVHEGNVYIDASEWTPTREYAQNIGRERGELAIWDCRSGNEVNAEDE